MSGSEVRGICLSGGQADLRKVHGVIGAEIRGKKIAVPDIHKQFDEHGGLVDQKPSHVAYVTGELNERPRKGLGYDTPAARFATETATIPTPLG